MTEFEFIVSGRMIVAAHCLADAEEAVKDGLDEVLMDYSATCIA